MVHIYLIVFFLIRTTNGYGTFKNNGSGQAPKATEETRTIGGVGIEVYWEYLKNGANCTTLIFFVCVICVTQILYTGSDYWLALW